MKYVNLVIDNKSDKTDQWYTYGCRSDAVKKGDKVYVPFARGKRLRTAYVFEVLDHLPQPFANLRYVSRIDGDISLTGEMIETCCWMRRRYLCRYIDAVRQFVPAGTPSKRGRKRRPLNGRVGEVQHIDALTGEQKAVLQRIRHVLSRKQQHLFLLHGVTGSGKTEVYMQTIASCIAGGRSAIMLVPEISLTKQIIDRFMGRFGADRIAVLHSRLSQGERYDEWQRIRRGEVQIVIGARSAVFAPLEQIGVIILDEEHEATYKSDMTPKYETIEVAIKRTAASGGIVLAGSATPSVVSYQRSLDGIYERLTMTRRYNEVQLPQVRIVDMRNELQRGNTSVISSVLFDEMTRQLHAGKQIILLLNRRGYSTFLSCRRCGHVIRCPQCGISLTYHKSSDKGVCHYCGYEQEIPSVCPSCGSRDIRYFGSGTEKVEEEVQRLFPDVSMARLDMDTMKKKGAADQILDRFGAGSTRILMGTQVVAKGLDFPNVGLVGIVSADVSLYIPDFRSAERTFQLITQAAGRAGRGEDEGTVLIQTYTPDNYAVQTAARQDYESFFREEIQIRRFMEYPPFFDLIQILFIGTDGTELMQAAGQWKMQLHHMLGKDEAAYILAPQELQYGIGGDRQAVSLLMKSGTGKRGKFMGAVRALQEQKKQKKSTGYQVVIDVNPYSLWRN